jgi:hypothetical protein
MASTDASRPASGGFLSKTARAWRGCRHRAGAADARLSPYGVVSAGVLLFVNFLFLYKYQTHQSHVPLWAMALGYAAFFAAVFPACKVLFGASDRRAKAAFVAVVFCIVAASFAVLSQVNPYSIRVDRWSTIDLFWANFFNGRYPYVGVTHTGNHGLAGFPGLFIIMLPLWFAGDVGYFQPFSFALFAWLMWRYSKVKHRAVAVLLLFCVSPVYFWEVTARSELIGNMVMFIGVILLCERFRDAKTIPRMLLAGAVAGFVCCTRGTGAVIMLLYFVRYFERRQLRPAFAFYGAAAVVFLGLVLPVVAWNPRLFVAFGPFSIQLVKTPLVITLATLGVAGMIGGFKPSIRQVFFFSGLILFILMIITASLGLADVGWRRFFFNDEFDLSFFNYCIPFMVMALCNGRRLQAETMVVQR